MNKVYIKPGCISCGSCQFIAPEVFEVTDVSRIKPDADLEQHAHAITLAAQRCPVQVITCED